MGLILGLDFGTTYSMLSMKDSTSEIVVPCKRKGKEFFEDSLVFVSENGTYFYGDNARSKAGVKGTLYSGFKMLLNETNPEELESHYYNETITPYYITKKYIDSLLYPCMKSYSANRIERLVIGVPDVWDKQATKTEKPNPLLKNRNSLLKIIRELGYVDDVELYSEPELASAYYLDNYKRSTNTQNYSGHLLLIDYGGGTLDVAICKFDSYSNDRAGVLKTFGEGWNEKGKKGDAGLAFMQRVIEIVINESNLKADERSIRECLYCLETALTSMNPDKAREMESVFRNGLYQEVANGNSKYSKMPFDDALKFGNDTIIVTYQHLAKAYTQIIDPVLKSEELNSDGLPKGVLIRAKQYLEENGIDYSIRADNVGFKIQLVGGFSNFYLVQKTVEDVFGKDANDIRLVGGFSDENARNYAISFGAALVANRDIIVTRMAQYALGIYRFESKFIEKDGRTQIIQEGYPLFAIHIKDEIIPGKIYLVNLENGEPKIWRGSKIECFAFCDDETLSKVQPLKPKEDYQADLQLEDKNSAYIFGLSFDRSMIISIHKWKVLDGGRKMLIEYKKFIRAKDRDSTFGDAIHDDPEKYSVIWESSDSLDDIFTMTGTSLM